VSDLARLDADGWRQLAGDVGGRWRALAMLDRLSADRHAAAIDGLIEAEWSFQRAPDALVEWSRDRPDLPGAWALQAQAGDDAALRAALARPGSRNDALRMVLMGRAPLTDGVRADVEKLLGDDPLVGLAPHLDAVDWETDGRVVAALVSSEPPGVCEALRITGKEHVGMGHDWVVDALIACPAARVPAAADPEGLAQRIAARDMPAAARDRLVRGALFLSGDADALRLAMLGPGASPDTLTSLLRTVERIGGSAAVRALLSVANDPRHGWAHDRVRVVLGVKD